MDRGTALTALEALAQGTRLDALKLLSSHVSDGLAAGEVARQLHVPQNTMSVHLRTLARAGLIQSERRSRNVIYRADRDQVLELTTFLIEECYGGKAQLKDSQL